jgi:hypothetical protein
MKEEVTGGWRKFHSVGIHNVYSSDIIRTMKSRAARQGEQVARVEEAGNA